MIYRCTEQSHDSLQGETRDSGLVPNEKADFQIGRQTDSGD